MVACTQQRRQIGVQEIPLFTVNLCEQNNTTHNGLMVSILALVITHLTLMVSKLVLRYLTHTMANGKYGKVLVIAHTVAKSSYI